VVERHTVLHEARGEEVAQIMPAKLRDRSAFEERRPGFLESGCDFKDTSSTLSLLTPLCERSSCLLIQKNVTSLTILGGPALNRQGPAIEVDAFPTECQQL
jgi:hypothetical protein